MNRNEQHRRDPFPYVMGGVIGALVVGLMMVVFLLGSNSPNNVGTVPAGAGVTTLPQGNNQPLATQPASNNQIEPTRMPIEEFMALYNDPAKRPLIVDVRAKAAYEAGHIDGAISLPDGEMESRLAELPKDKLIVAYCQ